MTEDTLQAPPFERTWRDHWPEFAAALVWLVAVVLLHGMAVWHDVTWQLWVARHLNAGVQLYSYIMETNPPLWFWMAQPVDLLSAASGIDATIVLVTAIFGLIGIAMVLAGGLAAHWTPVQRAALYAGIMGATVLACLADFAQREPLVLIGTIPYAMLIARRVEGRETHWLLVLGVALLATPMLALKHYFVLIPVLLELWLIWHRRGAWRPLRIETVTLVLGALLYGAAVVLLTPRYLTDIVPGLTLAFGGLRAPLLVILVNQMNLMLVCSAFYFWHFRREMSPQVQAMLLLGAAFTLSYYLQFRGWGYHASPVVGCLLLALVLHLALRPARSALRWSEAVLAGLMLVVAVGPQMMHGPYRNGFDQAADQLLARAEPGMTFAMLTTQAARPWPAVERKHLKWSSRYFQFWMLPAVANLQAAGTPFSPELETYLAGVRRETVEDFSCNPPDILIDDRFSIDSITGFDQPEFDILAFFKQDPRFAALMEAYTLSEQLGPFGIYLKTGPVSAPTAPCVTLTLPRT